MKRALFSVLGVAALCVALVAHAATRTFSWTAPTEYEDGTALPSSAITGYSINCGNAQGGPYDVLNVRAPGAVLSQSLDVPPGQWFCTARTIVGTGATEIMSERSNEVSFTVPQPAPRAPGAFSVN